MDSFLTFGDVARRMRNARIQQVPYWNRRRLEGTTFGFFCYCEWFEVNVHDAPDMNPEDALNLLLASPDTELNNSDTDDYGAVRWFGGQWVGEHHVRVWYNPQAF